MIDWNDAFDNSGYVAGSALLPDVWLKLAAEARAQMKGELHLAYGDDPRERYDLFSPVDQPKGLVVFVHGGYWQMLDKSYWSHLATGAYTHGWAVAVLSYPLAPMETIPAMTQSVARALSVLGAKVVGPLRLIGHSAGGHLVSRMACENSSLMPQLRQRLQRVVSVSGVHDLRPLILTEMNNTLALNEASAMAESPCLQVPIKDLATSFWVGADERPEFLRQNRLIAESWARQGADVSSHYEPACNHFTVVNSLQFADGALTAEMLR